MSRLTGTAICGFVLLGIDRQNISGIQGCLS
jgi:hypothetical protein